jgi:hypothetical protein
MNTNHPTSDAFAAIHDAAQNLQRVGAISKTTMREYDALCLATTLPYRPIALGVKMDPDVSSVQPLDNDALLLTFTNGEQRVFDREP